MCGAFTPATEHEDYLQSMRQCLTGSSVTYHIPAAVHNRTGLAEGVLTGGNLALLAHLTGSVSEVDTSNKILFIEDLSEYLYNADRMLMNLKRAGKLTGLKGLIVGGFTEMKDTERPFGQTIEEIIMDKVREYDYPVCFNFPAGHQDINYSLTLGAVHNLSVSSAGSTLELKNS
jgi:muramoyltetrapeptide carboxypeptidase